MKGSNQSVDRCSKHAIQLACEQVLLLVKSIVSE